MEVNFIVVNITTINWVKVLGAVSGLVATFLGIYNFVSAHRKERRDRQSQEEDLERYIALHKEIEKNRGNGFEPEFGSETHKWAERMVEKGLLKREAGGYYYTIPTLTDT